MNQENGENRLERISQVTRPSEFVKMFRSMVAEENRLSEDTIFPLDDDAASDVVYTTLGLWLAMCATPPLEAKAEVAASIDRMISLLKELQRHLPEEERELKRDVLHCMRRAVTPDYWPHIK
jgi:hypothetical protein